MTTSTLSESLALRMDFCEAKQEMQCGNLATFRFFEIRRSLKNELRLEIARPLRGVAPPTRWRFGAEKGWLEFNSRRMNGLWTQ